MFAPTLAALALAQAGKPADVWPAPVPRVFSSVDGLYGMKVLPTADARGADGTLFQVAADGTEQVVWRRRLECLPVEVRVSGQGHVATIDVWGKKGGPHSLVLYNRQGKTVADLPLKGLFEAFPVNDNPFFLATAGSIHWTLTTEVGYDLRDLARVETPPTASGSRFALMGLWKETVIFDPDTGKVIFRKRP